MLRLLEIEREEPVGSERGVDALAVGHGSRRGVAVFRVRVLDAVLRDGHLPKGLPVGALIGEQRQASAAVTSRREENLVLP